MIGQQAHALELDLDTQVDAELDETLILPDLPIWVVETELVNPEPEPAQDTLDWIDLDMLYLLARAARAGRIKHRKWRRRRNRPTRR